MPLPHSTDAPSRDPGATPRSLGYRMPAEWEPHESTWISWPHNLETWPDEIEHVETTIARGVRALSRGETVRINVNSAVHEDRARRILEQEGVRNGVIFHHIPTDDAWVRDYGPIFVRSKGGELAATCWGFNSWGEKYPPFERDDAAAELMAAALGIPHFHGDMILEGGSIEVNGRGLLLTTESCLLNPNRNPHLDKAAVEDRLTSFLGVERVVWLAEGIAGDDTDGHIDDLTRFVTPERVVTAVESDPASPNYAILKENMEVLRDIRLRDGSALHIIPLPMPDPRELKGERMPATYANFYIGNRTVLVPTFHDDRDDEALGILREQFPRHDVVGIYCGELIWGLGAFHCLTQQVPTGTTQRA